MDNFYDLIVCPLCEGHLSLTSFKSVDNKVKDGLLLCESCNKNFLIADFIPRMVGLNIYRNEEFENKYSVDKSKLVNSFEQTEKIKDIQENTDFYFGQEWEYYSRLGWDNDTFGCEKTVKDFWEKTLLRKEDLYEKLILDAGCGNGRFSRITAENGARVVAVDIGRNVDVARNNLQNVNLDVFVIQGDMLYLPFKKNVFDTIFTIGVLQHTGNPEKAFKSLMKTLKKLGIISIRAYHKGNPTLEANDKRIREITTKFSVDELHEFSKIMHDLTQFFIRKNLLPDVKMYINIFDGQHNIFDWYAAPIADKLTYDQVRGWFNQEGIKCIKDIDPKIPEKERRFSAISILGEKLK